MSKDSYSIIPIERIQRCIYLIRGYKVLLDMDLAELYGVSTKRLNEQVRRNIERFPADFMFQLTGDETERLRSQFATSKQGRGGRRYPPYAFTKQGVAMLSSVLRSKRAVEANIAIMRTFVKLRQILSTNAALRRKIEAMERRYDEQFKHVFKILSEMVIAKPKKKSQIGFLTEAKGHTKQRKKAKPKRKYKN